MITGTGRSGTTFLVQLLTRLKLDTGFTEQDIELQNAPASRAGLEFDIRQPGVPYIVKNPSFCDYAAEVLKRGDIVLDHVFIPMRDIEAAAESRRHVVKERVSRMSFLDRVKYTLRPYHLAGGVVEGPGARRTQEEVLLMQMHSLLMALSEEAVPVTFLRFPRIVKDSRYLHGKLQPILNGMDFETFDAAFTRSVRPQLVHTFSKVDN